MKSLRRNLVTALLGVSMIGSCVLVSGCTKKDKKTAAGAVIGGAAGAGIGAAAGGGTGAAIGGAVGAVTGGIIGRSVKGSSKKTTNKTTRGEK